MEGQYTSELVSVKVEVDELNNTNAKKSPFNLPVIVKVESTDYENEPKIKNGDTSNLMEGRHRSSGQQMATMLEFMERHGDLARPQPGALGRLRADQMWDELSVILNSQCSGGSKTVLKWKKVWADWKAKTKKKSLTITRNRGTGVGPGSRLELTELEQRVLTVMGAPVAVTGLSEVSELGFQGPNAELITVDQSNTDDSTVVLCDSNESQSILLQQSTSKDPDQYNVHLELMENGVLSPSPPQSLPPTQLGLSPPPLPNPPSPQPGSSQQGQRPTSIQASHPAESRTQRRKRKAQTPFERAAEEFSSVERRRLQFEADRDKRQYELDLRRLELEAQRNEIERNRVDSQKLLAEAIMKLTNIFEQIKDKYP